MAFAAYDIKLFSSSPLLQVNKLEGLSVTSFSGLPNVQCKTGTLPKTLSDKQTSDWAIILC
jgi:hypothetical protein